MAVPKKKTSKSRTKRRYSKWSSDTQKKLVNRILPRIGRVKPEEEVKVIKVDEDDKKAKPKKEDKAKKTKKTLKLTSKTPKAEKAKKAAAEETTPKDKGTEKDDNK